MNSNVASIAVDNCIAVVALFFPTYITRRFFWQHDLLGPRDILGLQTRYTTAVMLVSHGGQVPRWTHQLEPCLLETIHGALKVAVGHFVEGMLPALPVYLCQPRLIYPCQSQRTMNPALNPWSQQQY